MIEVVVTDPNKSTEESEFTFADEYVIASFKCKGTLNVFMNDDYNVYFDGKKKGKKNE